MKIYSEFKDYYDIGLTHGVDTSIHYNRKTTEVSSEFVNITAFNVLEFKILLFCGNIHYYCEVNDKIVYGHDNMRNRLKNDNWHYTWRLLPLIEKIERMNIDDLHIHYNSPILLLNFEANTVVINPILKDIEFYKIVDSYTAFQEISMYMSNKLNTDNKCITISNSEQIKKSGFNDKISFKHRNKLSK